MTSQLDREPGNRRASLRQRLPGLAQKANDLADFVYHRTRVRLRWRLERARRRLLLGRRLQRILIVRLASIGDVIRASAVVHRLREEHPEAGIDFLTTTPARPVIDRNPDLTAVHTLEDLPSLGRYDWVINLQNREPPASFLAGSGLTFRDVLRQISERLECRMISGRHLARGREVTPTDILYCRSEMEELYLTALLPFDPLRYPVTQVHVDEATQSSAARRFPLPSGSPIMAMFLGSNSIGCGADEGFRTYSIDYLERLIGRFYDRFTIVIVGQSAMRSEAERRQFAGALHRFPRVVDLVDRTSLEELVSVIGSANVMVSCDSSPVHIALARGVPVVGLYVNDATFRMSPRTENEQFICLNSTPPCFTYSWRWKFFCGTCRDASTRAFYCHNDAFAFGVDRIPIDRVDDAVTRLIGRRETAADRRRQPAVIQRTPDAAATRG